MAEYKKKSVNRHRKNIKNSVTERIPMQPSTTRSVKRKPQKSKNNEKAVLHKPKMRVEQTKSRMHVVKGNKLKIKLRRIRMAVAFAIILVVVILASLALPTGLLEFVENKVALIGKGSGYPNNVSDGSLLSVVQAYKNYITVTTGNIDGYNNNGKKIFSYQHGYTYPVLKASSQRFVLFSQGDKNYNVYNLNKELFSGVAENDILTMAIAEDGTYAVATTSDSYSSQVTVYDKNNKQIYKWMCADYIINNVTISPNGNHIAVSVFNTRAGKYVSRIYVLEYDSATPINLFEYEDQLILALNCSANNSFCATFEKGVSYFKWRDTQNLSFSSDKKVFFMKNNSEYSVVVKGVDANKTENEIIIFTSKGKQKSTFNFSEEIVDIAMRGKYVYILSHRTIYIYNIKGEFLSSAPCDFGVKRIVPISKFSVAALTDNDIDKITIG